MSKWNSTRIRRWAFVLSPRCKLILSITVLSVGLPDTIKNSQVQEELNEPTVQYVGGGFGPPKAEDILPNPAHAEKLRYEYEIFREPN